MLHPEHQTCWTNGSNTKNDINERLNATPTPVHGTFGGTIAGGVSANGACARSNIPITLKIASNPLWPTSRLRAKASNETLATMRTFSFEQASHVGRKKLIREEQLLIAQLDTTRDGPFREVEHIRVGYLRQSNKIRDIQSHQAR